MKVRQTGEQDRQLLQSWIDADEHHRGKTSASFFLEKRSGVDHFTVEDERGVVQFYVTLEKVARGHIQFNPEANATQNARALVWLGRFLKINLPRARVVEFVTESVHAPLIRFLGKLGLRRSENDYAIRLDQEVENVR